MTAIREERPAQAYWANWFFWMGQNETVIHILAIWLYQRGPLT